MLAAETSESGTQGEQDTARVLATLPSGEWRVFHDVRWPGRRQADIDHVIVGPGGVFVIDGKAWSGRVDVKGGSLRQDGRRRSRPVITAAAAAMAVGELVLGLDESAINPVICFAREEPVFGWCGDVMVCSTGNIVTFLTSRPRVFTEAEVLDIAQALSRSLDAAPSHLRAASLAGLAQPVARRPITRPPLTRTKSRRVSRTAHLPRHVRLAITVGIVGLMVGAAFAFDVPARVGELGSQAAEHVIAPEKTVGTAVTVPALGSRPSLQVTAQAPVATRSTMPGLRPRNGQQLVAVPLTVENTGDGVWRSSDDLHAEATDSADENYSSDPAYTGITAGRTLPAKIELRAGKTTRGYVVFEVPRGTRIAKVRVTVGPGLAKTLRWSVD